MIRQNFPGGSDGKAAASVWETGVRSLGGEDPLEKEMATHPSILARKISWTEESGRPQSTRSYRVRHGNEVHACVRVHTYTHTLGF